MCDRAHGGVYLRFEHLPEWRVQDGLRKRGDVIRYSLADEEHGKIIREIVAVVREQIVRLEEVLDLDE